LTETDVTIIHHVTSNSIQTSLGVVGWPFDADDETWIVDPGITVSSATTYGFINDNHIDDTLDNFGTVKTYAQVAAVFFDGNSGSATVQNEAGATISGARNGIDFNGNGDETLTNFGMIVGGDNNGVFFSHHALSVSVTNHGTIFGAVFGVENASQNVGGTIDNFNVIQAGGVYAPPNPPSFPGAPSAAIFIDTAPTLITYITNRVGALIDGPVDSIEATIGRFQLINHGTIIGNIVDADGGNDLIINTGKIKGAVFLDGNSVYYGRTGSSGGIHVGSGNATVTGGKGVDHFVFDSPITTQVTTITNFKHGVDKIVLSESDFPALGAGAVGHVLRAFAFHVGAVATTPFQHIVCDHAHGILYYDPDGSAGPQIEIATLTDHSVLKHADILIVA
jgi:hypothetical protein